MEVEILKETAEYGQSRKWIAHAPLLSSENERIREIIYKTRDLARENLFDYTEVFYSLAKRHSHLGGVSPEAFEQDSS